VSVTQQAAMSNSGKHPTRINEPFIIGAALGRVMPSVGRLE
jgi:hypothetical protein